MTGAAYCHKGSLVAYFYFTIAFHVELRARGIPASNTPGVLSGATADMAFALLMACARRIPEVRADKQRGIRTGGKKYFPERAPF